MLGKFGFGFENMNKPSESITKKLSEANTTLEDLLKEEELLQEFRSQNKDLIKFFNKEKIKEMLNYIIKEQVDEQEKGYKFPFLCSQIFGLEIEDIMKYFFTTNKEMEESEKKEEQDDKNINIDDSEVKKEEPPKEENKKEEPPKEEEKKEEDKKEEPSKEDKKEEEKPEEKQAEKLENKQEEKTEEKQEEKPEEKAEEKTEEKPEEKAEEKPEEKKEEKAEEKPEEKKEEKQEEENNEENEQEEKSEEESKEDKIEVLDYLFENFFPEDDSNKLNYVLSGYFSSLINNLLSMKPIIFLKYMYLVRNEYLNKMVDHFYRKSISDTLGKIIHFENYLQNLIEPLEEKERNKKLFINRYFRKN